MRIAVGLLVGLAGGCNSLFGLDSTRPLPDGPPSIDAPPDGACSSATVYAIGDGPIFRSNPTQSLSDLSLANVSATLTSHGVFKFDVSSLPQGTWYSLQLVLPVATHDDACGGACAPCSTPTYERDGLFHVMPMRSDWDERTATVNNVSWNCRRGPTACAVSDQWDLAGAQGLADRGNEIPGGVMHTAGQDTTLVIRGAAGADVHEAQSWVQGKLLSFQLVPDSAGNPGTVIRTHEHTCDATAHPASLTATSCP